MKNIYYPLGLLLAVCLLCSCKKSNIIGKTQNATLIVGKWLIYQQHTQVFDLNTGNLLKDTSVNFYTTNMNMAWYNIYNTDGTAYVTTMPYKKAGATALSVDTTSYLHYTIRGSSLTLNQNSGGTETDPILQLDGSILTLKKTYNSEPPSNLGLDVNTYYEFVVDDYFEKQ